tara:strand:- start:267 stop:749 length:483 start_codon:yes stop_codon:yes gene_type:complete
MGLSKIVAAVVILFLVYIFSNQSVERDDAGQIASEGTVDIFQIRVGDCFNDKTESLDASEVSSVGGIPCDLPHDNEIYDRTLAPQGVFPGEESITDIASQYCLANFEAFVGASYQDSLLNITYLYPTQDSWNSVGDREIFCIVFDMNDEKMLGSMENSRY